MSDDDRRVVSLREREWLRREELAEALDVSPRTLTAMIQRGDVERRQGATGPEYRYVAGEGEEEEREEGGGEEPRVEEGPTEIVRVWLSEWVEVREARVRAEVELEGARRDVARAVEYAEALEGEVREAMGLRARYHLEAGRREVLEEEIAAVREERDGLRGEVEELKRELRRAEEGKVRAKLGGFEVEIKRRQGSDAD